MIGTEKEGNGSFTGCIGTGTDAGTVFPVLSEAMVKF